MNILILVETVLPTLGQSSEYDLDFEENAEAPSSDVIELFAPSPTGQEMDADYQVQVSLVPFVFSLLVIRRRIVILFNFKFFLLFL